MAGAHVGESHVERELASQPNAWRAAVEAASAAADVLPRDRERVAVIGCGTSLYMARAYSALREASGHGETDAWPASEIPVGRNYDRVVAITRSGTTTEVVEAVAKLAPNTPTVVLTVAAGVPVAVPGADIVTLPFAAEQSVVQTVFATSVLALLRASLGENLDTVIKQGETAVSDPLPVNSAEIRQVSFLGRGWAAGIADEAALKCREAGGAWTESYHAMEYRHGPISVSGAGTVVWVFGDVPDGLERDASATGAAFVHAAVDPMADLIRAQRLAVEWAKENGRNPDAPENLTFSVILS